jgi:hypothetical protein
MVFNGLEKSELVIFNALKELQRKSFHVETIETLTGYSRFTIMAALRNLQEKQYIFYYKNSRFGPYFFEIIQEASHVVSNARSGILD